MNIILIGFMGAGKSTLGQALASELKYNFIDSDQLIEQEHGSIVELFNKGEEHFRQIESQVINNIDVNNTVIALGGGAINNPSNIKKFEDDLIIYVNTSLEQVQKRIEDSNRPLKKDAQELYIKREQLYKQYSNFEVNGDMGIETNVNVIKKILESTFI